MDSAPRTRELLVRFHEGDPKALGELLERHLGWIRSRVVERLGAKLRGKADTQDFVQEAVLEVLRHGPRFTVSSDEHFRALLARIVENVLCDQHQRFEAARRRASIEKPLPTDSVLDLDPRRGATPTPSAIADRREREAWLRLGLELVSPEDREVILLRQQDRLAYDAIGERLGVPANTARMRFERAVARLGDVVARIRIEGVESVTRDPA
ncbi:MAG TPA: sigma-70 family RNA polymerase sigma factor [Planctomycetota bacterium]|nr:sigma-70 family RNA polymerase sigma factor [Planctomycetota bacterium]